jgi:hypothetical protein
VISYPLLVRSSLAALRVDVQPRDVCESGDSPLFLLYGVLLNGISHKSVLSHAVSGIVWQYDVMSDLSLVCGVRVGDLGKVK